MNEIFKGLLSLHGYRLPFESIEGVDGRIAGADYAIGYGNRGASQRAFPTLGHGRRRSDTGTTPDGQVCTAGACG